MTATEPASLDALLANATPVEAEPFDVRAAMVAYLNGYPSDEDLAHYVNGLRVDTERARALAVKLENENAELTDVITQVVVILNEALTWHRSETDNTACAAQAAIALLTEALRGGAE